MQIDITNKRFSISPPVGVNEQRALVEGGIIIALGTDEFIQQLKQVLVDAGYTETT